MSGVNDHKPRLVVRRTTTALHVVLDGTTDNQSKDQGASMVALFEMSANTLERAPNVKPER
jgi:hypothetical protein